MDAIFIILLAVILSIGLTMYTSYKKPVSPEQRRLLQISVGVGVVALLVIFILVYLP
ncbi:MAG: hypothetical protein H6635_03860 [Anaerolineales bacterium]|nr:hypothetical protein [Anaerolineales bacterium]MCB9144482.1 hypothetical protein [Anaerolineales bacterium]